MNKPPFKGPVVQPKDQPAPVTRLDEKLTQLAINTARAIHRRRNTLFAVAAVVLLGLLASWGYREYERSQELGLSARVFEQFHSTKAEKLSITGAEPAEISRILDDIRSLVADSRGTSSERWVIKEAVDYLIDKARDQVFPPADDSDPFALRPAGAPPLKPPAPPSPEVLGAAEGLVQEAQKKFRDDRDLQYWAEQHERSIAALRIWDLKKTARPFKPVLPPAEGAQPDDRPPPPPQDPEPPGNSK